MRQELSYIYRLGDKCSIPSLGCEGVILGTIKNGSNLLEKGDILIEVSNFKTTKPGHITISVLKDHMNFDFWSHMVKGNNTGWLVPETSTIIIAKEDDIKFEPLPHNLKRGTVFEISDLPGQLFTVKYTTPTKVFITKGIGKSGIFVSEILRRGFSIKKTRLDLTIQKELGL